MRAAVLMDYQNVHLSVADCIAPQGTPPRDTLIHPLRFAETVLAVRAQTPAGSAVLESVRAFRGVPSQKHQSDLYAAAQAQRSEWTKDPRVQVDYRTLRYPYGWPQKPAREKGVDVRVAIELVSLAIDGTYDLLILASHDTDLEPALEMAVQRGSSKIETAGWEGGKRLRVPGQRLWHTALDFTACGQARDRKNYWGN